MRSGIKGVAQRVFLAGDRVGIHVLPSHYYSPVASRRALRTTEAYWRRRLDPIPFRWDIGEQVAWLKRNVGTYPAELPLDDLYRMSEAVGGFRYGPIEAQLLHAYIRSNAPRRIVEIGSGSSTLVMSRAVERNVSEGRAATDVVALDPYTADRVAGLPHVRARSAGGLAITRGDLDLVPGDVLFIDSTHAVRTGSELSHLYLELLPTLSPGVVVHIHDIYLPYLYSPQIYDSMFDWQETTLVAALLAGDSQFEILTCLSGLFHDCPAKLTACFPEFRPMAMRDGIEKPGTEGHFPAALWLRKT